jgi:uncharacterized protein (DUF1800 family)
VYANASLAQQHAPHTAVPPLIWDPVEHLLNRFSFGADPASRGAVSSLGPEGWWAAQIAAGRSHPGYSAHAPVAAQGPLLTQNPAQVRAWLKAQGNEYDWTAMDQLTRVTLGLQAWSPAQLYETVVDFFSNHLNVANHNGDVWTTRHVYDRDVIRKYAFGSFSDMLVASSKSPAMLLYLNLAESTKSAVNENYGRELLELHTYGLGYSEADVVNAARLLTGRTIDSDYNYIYQPTRHWVGAISVLGFRHDNTTAAGGEAAGDALLRYLASHPRTAVHLARKLCQRFVSDTPSASLVTQVARAYLAAGTQILPTIQAIFRSDEFWSSRGAKVRRPAENLLATVRILGNRPSDYAKALNSLHWMSAAAGHTPLDWSAPNGYPDVAVAWRSSGTLLNLWEYHRGFAQSWWEGFAALSTTSLYGPVAPATSGAAIDVLTRRLTRMTFSTADKATLQNFLGEPASTPLAKSILQWRLGDLIPLILDAPHFALR